MNKVRVAKVLSQELMPGKGGRNNAGYCRLSFLDSVGNQYLWDSSTHLGYIQYTDSAELLRKFKNAIPIGELDVLRNAGWVIFDVRGYGENGEFVVTLYPGYNNKYSSSVDIDYGSFMRAMVYDKNRVACAIWNILSACLSVVGNIGYLRIGIPVYCAGDYLFSSVKVTNSGNNSGLVEYRVTLL